MPGVHRPRLPACPRLRPCPAAPNPLTYFLGSLAGCTQYTIHMIAREMKLPPIERIAWAAEGEYDLRGVRGEPGVSARSVGRHSWLCAAWRRHHQVVGLSWVLGQRQVCPERHL
jgi:hypothetical protein